MCNSIYRCYLIYCYDTFTYYKVAVLMDLTSTPVSVILDMLEVTVTLIMTTAVLLLAFMVSGVSCF